MAVGGRSCSHLGIEGLLGDGALLGFLRSLEVYLQKGWGTLMLTLSSLSPSPSLLEI